MTDTDKSQAMLKALATIESLTARITASEAK